MMRSFGCAMNKQMAIDCSYYNAKRVKKDKEEIADNFIGLFPALSRLQ